MFRTLHELNRVTPHNQKTPVPVNAGSGVSFLFFIHKGDMVFQNLNQKIKTIGNKTKNDNGRNDHIQLKHLCAVNDQITKSLSGSEKLADDNAD